jgi:hypothetical protein
MMIRLSILGFMATFVFAQELHNAPMVLSDMDSRELARIVLVRTKKEVDFSQAQRELDAARSAESAKFAELQEKYKASGCRIKLGQKGGPLWTWECATISNLQGVSNDAITTTQP